MIQKNIRDYNNQEYSKDEGSEIIKELDDRTKHVVDGYNSISQLGTKVKELEDNPSAITIIDNLNTADADKPLSANQGKVLKETIYALIIDVKTSNDFDILIVNTTVGTWRISNSFMLNADKIIPAGVTLEFVNNAIIDLNGFSLTGNNTKIVAPPAQLFTESLSGTWDIAKMALEWFGAKGDGITNDSNAIETALNSFERFVGVHGKTYLLSSQISIPTSQNIEIDLQGATLKRNTTYTTAESVFNSPVISQYSFEVTNGKIEDGSTATSVPFFNTLQRYKFSLTDMSIISKGRIYNTSDSKFVTVLRNVFQNIDVIPLTGSRFGDILNSSNIWIENNTSINTFSFIKVESIGSSQSNEKVKIVKNNILKTVNTAIFCRMIGTGGNLYRGCLIDGNYLEDIGKTPIKFSAPSTATSGLLEYAIITNNIIKGFAFNVSSPAIAVFRDDANSNIDIEGVIVSNNIIDGFGTSGTGTVLSTPGDARGIRIQNVKHATINNNIIRNTASEGMKIDKSSNITCLGNTIDNTCLQNVGVSGIALFSVKDSIFNNIVTNTQNGKDGINLELSRGNKIEGIYKNNTGYGLNETSNGSIGTKSGKNIYTIISENNTLINIYMRGESNGDRSVEVNCLDELGSRHLGTSSRRDNLNNNDWGFNRNKGFVYWNTDNNDLEVFDGLNWKKVNGNAVDS